MSTIEPVKVKGLREFQASLKAMDGESQKRLRLVLNEAAELVVDHARRGVPTRTGKARGSIKMASSQREARVKAGGAKAPYYPWLDYGGRVGRGRSVARAFRPEGRYLYPAARAERARVMSVLEANLLALARETGLEVT